MVELSHRPLRELIASFGACDRYYTEMTSASGYLANSPFDRWFMDSQPDPSHTVVQLFDSEIEPIAKAALRLDQERKAAGAPLGGIDLNFGCSAPQIERAGGGVSWMKDARRAAALMAAVRAAAPGIPHLKTPEQTTWSFIPGSSTRNSGVLANGRSSEPQPKQSRYL